MPTPPSLPIVGHFDAAISSAMAREIGRLAQRLKRDEPALSSARGFADRVSAGFEQVPNVLLGDPGGPGLWTLPGDWALEYRLSSWPQTATRSRSRPSDDRRSNRTFGTPWGLADLGSCCRAPRVRSSRWPSDAPRTLAFARASPRSRGPTAVSTSSLTWETVRRGCWAPPWRGRAVHEFA